MAKRKTSKIQSCCPITNDPKKKLVSNAQTDEIKDNFPAGVARPALRALVAAGLTSLEQLTEITSEELLSMHGIGQNALEKLRAGLREKGMDFRPRRQIQ